MPLKGSYPEPGDLVEFYRGVYQHWGVYVGDGKVVHLTTGLLGSSGSSCSSSSSLPGVGKGMVKEESLETVAGEDTYRVNNKYDEKRNPRPADEIVKAAREEVGKKKKYAVTCANCEHFVTELRYGSSYSDQGRTAKSVIRYGLVGIASIWFGPLAPVGAMVIEATADVVAAAAVAIRERT